MNVGAENLSFSYEQGQKVLDDISHCFGEGVVTAVFGPNGSGKSTLVRCLNGSLKPNGGHINIGSSQISTLSRKQIATLVSVVPQDTPADIPFTAFEMVMLGRYAHNPLLGGCGEADVKIVQDALKQLSISQLAQRSFNSLSGGERQRVILARAIAQQCPVMLFDEPDTHLDISHQLELYKIMRTLANEGRTVVVVCHNIFIAPMFVDQAVLLSKGKIAAAGKSEKVITREKIAEVFGADIDITRTGSKTFNCSIS